MPPRVRPYRAVGRFIARHGTFVLLGACLLTMFLYGREMRERGQIEVEAKRLQQQRDAREKVIAVLAKQKAKVDALAAQTDTQYVAAKVDYAAIRDSILKELGGSLDSAARNESPIVRLIQACDATIRAADSALAACKAQVAIRDTLLAHKDTIQAATDSLLRLERKRRNADKLFGFIPKPHITAGLNADERGVRPGLQVGVRLF